VRLADCSPTGELHVDDDFFHELLQYG